MNRIMVYFHKANYFEPITPKVCRTYFWHHFWREYGAKVLFVQSDFCTQFRICVIFCCCNHDEWMGPHTWFTGRDAMCFFRSSGISSGKLLSLSGSGFQPKIYEAQISTIWNWFNEGVHWQTLKWNLRDLISKRHTGYHPYSHIYC